MKWNFGKPKKSGSYLTVLYFLGHTDVIPAWYEKEGEEVEGGMKKDTWYPYDSDEEIGEIPYKGASVICWIPFPKDPFDVDDMDLEVEYSEIKETQESEDK